MQGINQYYPYLEARGLYTLAETYLDKAQQIEKSHVDEIVIKNENLFLQKNAWKIEFI